MKGILKFNLPEEQSEFQTAINGIVFKIILCRLDNFLEKKMDGDLSEDSRQAYSFARHFVWDELASEHVDLYD